MASIRATPAPVPISRKESTAGMFERRELVNQKVFGKLLALEEEFWLHMFKMMAKAFTEEVYTTLSS